MAAEGNINTLEKAKFADFGGETVVRVLVVNQALKNYGRELIPDGSDTVVIAFNSAMTSTSYAHMASIEVDEFNPIFHNLIVKDKTLLGMTVQLNAPVVGNNYFLNWAVMEN